VAIHKLARPAAIQLNLNRDLKGKIMLITGRLRTIISTHPLIISSLLVVVPVDAISKDRAGDIPEHAIA
jgi:hypothetical protein